MKTSKQAFFYYRISAGVLVILLLSDVYAHDYKNLDEVMIDLSNNMIAVSVLQVQDYLSGLMNQTNKPPSWPDRKITILRRDLMHQMEDAGMSLNYFQDNGTNLQSNEELLNYPLAGRSVAASQALGTAYELLKHIDTLESQDDFIREIYLKGKASQMYQLLSAQREKIDLYKALFNSIPDPARKTTSDFEEATATPTLSKFLPYLLGALILCIVLAWYLKKKNLSRYQS